MIFSTSWRGFGLSDSRRSLSKFILDEFFPMEKMIPCPSTERGRELILAQRFEIREGTEVAYATRLAPNRSGMIVLPKKLFMMYRTPFFANSDGLVLAM
jgi:hypothetical protein